MSKKQCLEEEFDNYIDYPGDTNQELKDRGIYYITGQISENSLLEIHQDVLLKHLDPHWKDDIQLIINSPGGMMNEMNTLIDLLDWVRMDIHTTAIGEVASAGACLACCGTKGKRVITPNTTVMIHGPMVEVGGNKGQIVSETNEMKRVHNRMVQFWIKHSKYKTEKQIEKHFLHGKYDVFMDAEEAVKHGIFDHIT